MGFFQRPFRDAKKKSATRLILDVLTLEIQIDVSGDDKASSIIKIDCILLLKKWWIDENESIL